MSNGGDSQKASTQPAMTDPVAVCRETFRDPKVIKLAIAIAGLFAFFLVYGVVQERIMTKTYGSDPNDRSSYFQYSAFLVLNNRVCTTLMAVFLAWRAGEPIKNVAPLWTYGSASVSNFIATLCQYEALKYVSFPTQTLAKCGKVIPILVLGTLGIGVKKYGRRDYFEGLIVTAGCFLFAMTGETKANVSERDDSMYGLALMALYLFSDGFTSTIQENVFKNYKVPSSNLMIYVNLSSAILSIVTLVGSGQLWPALEFAAKYPAFWLDAFGLSLCAMLGQQVIYYIIKNGGALLFATAMTTRQFVAILLSCAIYLHPLSNGQWLATILLWCTMYWKAASKRKAAAKKDTNEDLVKQVHVAVDQQKSSGRS